MACDHPLCSLQVCGTSFHDKHSCCPCLCGTFLADCTWLRNMRGSQVIQEIHVSMTHSYVTFSAAICSWIVWITSGSAPVNGVSSLTTGDAANSSMGMERTSASPPEANLTSPGFTGEGRGVGRMTGLFSETQVTWSGHWRHRWCRQLCMVMWVGSGENRVFGLKDRKNKKLNF